MSKGAGRDRRTALRKLLSVLVSEWGYAEVRYTLELVGKDDSRTLSGVDDGTGAALRRSKKAYVKPSATDIVSKLDVEESRKALLMELADQFESKRFLPGIGDVRNFLEMRGKTSGGLTQRANAFRQVLNALLNTPSDGLEKMVRTTGHSGPSQLGPLSDAIKSARATVRSSAESSEPRTSDNVDTSAEGEKSPPPGDTGDPPQ